MQAGKVKPLAVAGTGDSPTKAVDDGGGEVRLAACLDAWATAEQTKLSLEASFAAALAQKEVGPGQCYVCPSSAAKSGA